MQTLFPHRSGDSLVSFLKDKSIDYYGTYSWKLIKEQSKYIEFINVFDETGDCISLDVTN